MVHSPEELVDDIQKIHRFEDLTNMNSFGDFSLDPSSIDDWAADIHSFFIRIPTFFLSLNILKNFRF